jgi:hypothetical protein
MNPSSNAHSRASEIWERFGGMFGADAVERKFGLTPPDEWKAMLSRLKDFEIDRGVRRLAYSGKAHVPSLPEFTRLCRAVGDDSIEDGPQRIALPNPEAFQGDGWDIGGNLRLLKHITTILSAKANALGEVPQMQVKRDPQGRPLHLMSAPSPQQRQTTAILLSYKQAWSQDMREWKVDEATGEVIAPTLAEQEAAWNGCMQRAMADIAKALA